MTQASTFELGASLDIAHAAKLKTQLSALLEGDGDILLDGAAVERLDAAGLQLLASWFKHCKSHQRSCTWSQSSELLRESAAGLGLACALELEENPSITKTEGQ